MANSETKKFLVLCLVPAPVMADWALTDLQVRKAAEDKMLNDWKRWMRVHAQMVTVTESAWKTKKVTSTEIADAKNDIILYSIVEADSHDKVASAFLSHPHLAIPQSSIEVTEVRAIGDPA